MRDFEWVAVWVDCEVDEKVERLGRGKVVVWVA